MSNRFLSFTLIAITVLVPHGAQTQTKDCAAGQRKELVLTALDKNGNLVDGLRAEQLSVKVGNSPATISEIGFRNTAALDIALLIDSSVSQEKVLPLEKAAAQSFIKSVPVAASDRVAVVAFSNEPKYISPLTSDFAAANAAIAQITLDIPPGYVGGGVIVSAGPPPRGLIGPGSTSLWDVIRSATAELFGAQADNRRRVVLLFTDGTDTSSSGKVNGVIEEAIKHDVAVYSIGMAGSERELSQDPLKKLSEQTGGVALFPRKKEQLETALTEVAKRLRGNYVIAYCDASSNRGKLQLEIIDPELRKTKPILAYKRY
jgi:VWFA-related protein